MSTYNKSVIVGRLGRDPDLRYTAAGTPVANMSIATNETYNDSEGNRQEKAEWHRIIVFGKQAENCSQYLKKGSSALVEGSLQTRKWQDKDNNDRYTTEIKAQRVVFLSTAQGQGQSQEGSKSQSGEQSQGEGGGQDPFQENLGPAFPSEAGAIDDAPF